MRTGLISPSCYADMMTSDRTGKGFGKTAIALAYKLAGERLGVQNEISAKALDWGNMYEPEAIDYYISKTGRVALPTDVIIHPHLPFVGGTPDGLVSWDGIIEVKCPFNPINHLQNLHNGAQLEDYKYQIQGYLWITGRSWCDFVSYSPLFPEELKMKIIRVERDEEMIEAIQARVLMFNPVVEEIVRSVLKNVNNVEAVS